MHSVRIEPTKMILVRTRITYQATGNLNQIWCVNIGECMVFESIVACDYCIYCLQHIPPRNSSHNYCI